jgi:hypothetical protein
MVSGVADDPWHQEAPYEDEGSLLTAFQELSQ